MTDMVYGAWRSPDRPRRCQRCKRGEFLPQSHWDDLQHASEVHDVGLKAVDLKGDVPAAVATVDSIPGVTIRNRADSTVPPEKLQGW